MNRQTFSEYLEQPAKLYQLSLTELQGLVLAYPYAANLRLLLLLKAKMENHPRAAEILQQAAARTFDRAFLFETLQELERNGLDGLQLPQEKLELQTLEDMTLASLDLAPSNNTASTVSEAHNKSLSSEASSLPLVLSGQATMDYLAATSELEEESALAEALSALGEPEEPQSISVGKVIEFEPISLLKFSADQRILLTAVALSELVGAMFHPSDRQPIEPPSPLAVSELLPSGLHAVAASLPQRLAAHKNRQLAALKNTQQPDQMAFKARQSVSESEEAVSETLAALLVKQGQYERAIKMYRRLSLQIPAKKATFAALIKELKDKL